jgi:hypothetical protein
MRIDDGPDTLKIAELSPARMGLFNSIHASTDPVKAPDRFRKKTLSNILLFSQMLICRGERVGTCHARED